MLGLKTEKEGYFLGVDAVKTDLKPTVSGLAETYVETLREQLGRSGLSMIEEDDISSCVVGALQLTSKRNANDVREQVPWDCAPYSATLRASRIRRV